jgi:hypothetical protein
MKIETMKKEIVGAGYIGAAFGWTIGSIILSIVIRMSSVVLTPTSFWLVALLPLVYGWLSWGFASILKVAYEFEKDFTKTLWRTVNFLVSLLAPLIFAIIMLVSVIVVLLVVIVLAMSPFFPTTLELELQRRDKEKDQEFIKAFEQACWKILPVKENNLVGAEGICSNLYDEKRDTFTITLSGDLTRKAIGALKAFSENSGYIVLKVRKF